MNLEKLLLKDNLRKKPPSAETHQNGAASPAENTWFILALIEILLNLFQNLW